MFYYLYMVKQIPDKGLCFAFLDYGTGLLHVHLVSVLK